MTKISIETIGEVDPSWRRWVKELLEALYLKVEEPPNLIYLILIKDRGSFGSYLTSTHIEAGVASHPAYDEYECSHDAFLGVPRIVLCEEALRNLPRRVQAGAILHEGAHSILHGVLEAYIMIPTINFQKLMESYTIAKELLNSFIFILSIAVKDYEATKLLLKLGFREEARAYIIHLLQPSLRIVEDWKIASSLSKSLTLLHLAELLKPLCCSSPIIEEVWSQAISFINHLTKELSQNLIKIASSGSWRYESTLRGKVEKLGSELLEFLKQLR